MCGGDEWREENSAHADLGQTDVNLPETMNHTDSDLPLLREQNHRI